MSEQPIRILQATKLSAESAFKDEDPGLLGKRFAKRAVSERLCAEQFEQNLADTFTEFSAAYPRTVTAMFMKSVSVIDRMRFIGSLPEEQASSFDAGNPTFETRACYSGMTRHFERDDKSSWLFTAIRKNSTIRYASIAMPPDSSELAEEMCAAIDTADARAIIDPDPDHPVLHLFTTGRTVDDLLGDIARATHATAYPYCYGRRVAYLHPIAWAILASVPANSALPLGLNLSRRTACTAVRPGTAPIRRAQSQWLAAVRQVDARRKGHLSNTVFGDERIITFPLAEYQMMQVLSYFEHLRSSTIADLERLLIECLDQTTPVPNTD